MFEVLCIALATTPFDIDPEPRGRKPHVDVSYEGQLLFTIYKTKTGFAFRRYPHPASEQYLIVLRRYLPFANLTEII